MINLTPIAEKIQKRLFEKMKVLGRSADNSTNTPIIDNDGNKNKLTHEKLSVRTPFLRMTSGQVNPVILMGGKVKDDGTIPGGYDDIYGPRSYTVGSGLAVGKDVTVDPITDIPLLSDNTEEITVQRAVEREKQFILQNNSGRPTPGVKSVEANFKGGLRAIREATVQWTCWDWEELQLLSPHFLSHGHTVMVEWGWVYDANTLSEIHNFMTKDEAGNKIISLNAFNNYRNKILESNGDFDMMVGIIKNFEYTTRDDGGFDCTTILTSVGASVIDNPQPNKDAIDPNITYNLSLNDNNEKAVAALREATDGGNEVDTEEKNALVDLNTSVSMKLFIKKIDEYLHSLINDNGITRDKDGIAYETNKYITSLQVNYPSSHKKTKETSYGTNIKGEKFERKDKRPEMPKGNKNVTTNVIEKRIADATYSDCWVRWGWFEDNILSHFLSVTSKKDVITQFRSIEKILNPDGTDSGKYESTRIKNHNRLETTDLQSYILPGQFYPVKRQSIDIGDEFPVIIDGDDTKVVKLSEIVNNNFSSFTASDKIKTITRGTDEFTLEFPDSEGFGDIKMKQETEEVPVPGKYGYLRNMLINTKVIKQAFGVNTEEFTIESINVIEAIDTMFSLINRDLNFWSFQLVVDEVDTYRAKIIDDQTTNFDFSQKTNKQKSTPENPNKVFFFPVWRSDSIVKRQNVTTKIPDALALTAMYGANFDKLSEFSNPGSQFIDKGALIAGAMFNNQRDNHKEGFDIAVRNKKSEKIGVKHGKDEKDNFIDDANTPLQMNGGGKGIRQFLIDNSDEMTKAYNDKLREIDGNIQAKEDKEMTKNFDLSIAPPMLGGAFQDTEIIKKILRKAAAVPPKGTSDKGVPLTGRGKSARQKFVDLIGKKFTGTNHTGFNDYKVRPFVLDAISYLTTQHGKSRQIDTPVLVPFDMELQIDGIGGIYPGNSFQSSYLPTRYQNNTVFQIFDVNHTLNESGWSVTITGKMRSTIDNIIDFKDIDEVVKDQLDSYLEQMDRINQSYDSVGIDAGKVIYQGPPEKSSIIG